jgi:hypothetical protein
MTVSLESKVGEILKNKKAVEVLEKYVPGITKNPMLALAKGMTLKNVLAMPQVKQYGITQEMITKVIDEINQAD